MAESDHHTYMKKHSTGIAQGTNVLGNLFSLNDVLSSSTSTEEMAKMHEKQKQLRNDFLSKPDEMRKTLGLLDCESIIFVGNATFRKENDINNFGLIILTEYRFIFQFLEKSSEKEKFKEDFFKIPFLLFDKLIKNEQKSTYLPFTIVARDGRKLDFFISEKNKDIFEELNSRAMPKKFDLLGFPKLNY